MTRNYLEIVERASTGPEVSKDDWDFDYIIMTTKDMVEKYNLTWDPEVITPDNPDLADRIFKAAKELILKTGIYSMATGRVIKFTEYEISEALMAMPKTLVMGEGKDERTLYAREVMDTRVPLIWAGNPGVPTPEELFLPTVKSWMQEPLVDLITCGSIVDVDGFTVKTGEVSELIATRRELQYLHMGLKQTGRMGMGMLAAESSVSELGDLAVSHPDYLRPCDSHLVALFNELMIDNGNMIRAANSIEYGMRNASLAAVMVGGLGGDAPGAAVLMAASFMAANIICLADYHLCHPIHINYVATSAPGCMWLQSVVCQAFARNAPSIIVCDIYPKSGALTRELLYEVAANTIAITVSGGHLEGVGAADGGAPNGTGLEVRLMAEVAHAVTKQRMNLEEANKLILKLFLKYEPAFKMEGGNPGKRFDEAYDLTSLTPVPEWQNMYEEVKQELIEMGINF